MESEISNLRLEEVKSPKSGQNLSRPAVPRASLSVSIDVLGCLGRWKMKIEEIEFASFSERRIVTPTAFAFRSPFDSTYATATGLEGEMSSIHSLARHAFPVLNESFLVDSTFEYVKELGQGAYGVVCAAKSKVTGESVAIKKVTPAIPSLQRPETHARLRQVTKVFHKKILTKRALRELKFVPSCTPPSLPLTHSSRCPDYSITSEIIKTSVSQLGTTI